MDWNAVDADAIFIIQKNAKTIVLAFFNKKQGITVKLILCLTT